MRKRVVLPMAVLMMLSFAGLSFAQPTTAAQPGYGKMAEMGKDGDAPSQPGCTISPARWWPWIKPAKTVTIKHMVRGQPKEATFNVEEKAAASLVNLQPNDRVRLSYSKEQGRLMAQSIVETSHKASK